MPFPLLNNSEIKVQKWNAAGIYSNHSTIACSNFLTFDTIKGSYLEKQVTKAIQIIKK